MSVSAEKIFWNSFGGFLKWTEARAGTHGKNAVPSERALWYFLKYIHNVILWTSCEEKKLKMHDIMLMKHSNKYNIFQAGRVGEERERKVSKVKQ